MTAYNHETNSGLTKSFKIMSDKIAIEFENATKNVENAQASVNETRKKLKNFMVIIKKKNNILNNKPQIHK